MCVCVSVCRCRVCGMGVCESGCMYVCESGCMYVCVHVLYVCV